ncbi:fatty acid desaturase [Parasphingopyxis sp.]|uniref:fatty acid desaturase n=1 Tax=Parasphingopyxis sp. TaxID=1920299 RepID=UPI00261B8741|nr:fatty acid desaturase [Parasphingopyxis sp.]
MDAVTSHGGRFAGMTKKELIRAEQAIAHKYMGGVPWLMVAWGLGNFAIWLALWPLVMTGTLPLGVGFLIACANVTLCYLPSHEAQHDIIGRKGTKWRWLNELIGHVSLIPLVLPYRVARLTHYEHHKHTNDPNRDPDHGTKAKGPLDSIRRTILSQQPGSQSGLNNYGAVLQQMGREDVILDGAIYKLLFFGTLCALAWSGYALEAIFLWWLPRQFGLIYIIFFLSWAPHHPAEEKGRYRNTRSWRSKLGNIGSLGMQFHLIHHLYPTIPLTRHPAVYAEMKPILEARGCRLGDL